MSTQPSQKQVEANRRNALKATGPKSAEGKAKSRRNSLMHGFSAEILLPEGDQSAYQEAMDRWNREAGPDNVVEEHLIRRAAVGSVNLDRIEAARQQSRVETARTAVAQWEKKQQARARRKAQGLAKDPSNTIDDLEATAFGCEWLIRQWQGLDAPLRLGKSWEMSTLARAQSLLGLPEGMPGVDAEPIVRTLWQLTSAAAPTTVSTPFRIESDLEPLADPAEARQELRNFIADRVARLEELRIESWEAVEGPDRESVIRLALAADTSKEGQLRHRYETAADRSCNAAIRLFLNLRDRRRRELLEIAKEARHCDTPRSPVGGGWWREPHSDSSPPGFSRVDDLRTLLDSQVPQTAETDESEPSRLSSAVEIVDKRSAKTPTDTSAPTQRNEPISSCDLTEDPTPNPNPTNRLRYDASLNFPLESKRTEPLFDPVRHENRSDRQRERRQVPGRHRSARRW